MENLERVGGLWNSKRRGDTFDPELFEKWKLNRTTDEVLKESR